MQNTTKEHNSVNNVNGDMDLAFCMSSYEVLNLYKVSQEYLKGI